MDSKFFACLCVGGDGTDRLIKCHSSVQEFRVAYDCSFQGINELARGCSSKFYRCPSFRCWLVVFFCWFFYKRQPYVQPVKKSFRGPLGADVEHYMFD